MRRARLAVAAAVCLVVAGTGSSASAETIFGPQRVLVVPVTWGPEPFTQEQLRRAVFDDAASFVRASSYGRASITGAITPWLHAMSPPSGCSTRAVARAGAPAAAAAGFPTSDYEYVIYFHPQMGCVWFGITLGSDVFLNGSLFPKLVEHELGHAFGLPHANTFATSCAAEACAAEYGDPYDTMGGGVGDFNPFEKSLLGWLPRSTAVRRNGGYALDVVEAPSTRSQALVVRTALDEYWIENRRDPARTVTGEVVGPPGVLVRSGPARVSASGAEDFTFYNLLVPDPTGRNRPAILPGETFVLPGVFSITVRSRTAKTARVRFAWRDRTPPGVPGNLALARSVFDPAFVDVAWSAPREVGSGIDRYLVSLDARPAASVARGARAFSLSRPGRGKHVVRIVAVDRAGNRSRAAVRRFTVPGA